VYDEDMNPMGNNIDTISKDTETLIDDSKEVGLKVNIEKTEYTLMSCYQNADQNQDIKIANISSENASQIKYMGTTITNRSLIQEEIWRQLNSGNACCLSVQHVSSHLLSKSLQIRINKIRILPMVVYGCET
jgi:hypothetical protein